MSLLRIYVSHGNPTASPQRCQWALFEDGREPIHGEGKLADLPQRSNRIQLVLPAEQVLIVRTRVPPEARKRAGSVLAFAIEEQTIGEPDLNQVSWLGLVGEDDVLAVVEKQILQRWRNALENVGIADYELHCETLLLPLAPGEWSVAWHGDTGFVRTGDLEGAATDHGDRTSPPMSLQMMLDEATVRDARPTKMTFYTTQPGELPDIQAWQKSLGIPIRLAGPWSWRTAHIDAGVALAQQRRRWSAFTGLLPRLRPAALLLGGALAIHAAALTIDWTVLARQQRALHQNMEMQFRAVVPDAVAVVDPALQMRRKLAEARHLAGVSDDGDFLPMIGKVSEGLKDLPSGNLRIISYESGRITMELANVDEAVARAIVSNLAQTGLKVEEPQGTAQTMIIIVRTS
jgi:general secretion pathway protein L